MTNEEIFESMNGGKDAVTSVKNLEWFTAHFVLSAMDAAREDEAIRFAEWLALNRWKKERGKMGNGRWYVPSAGYGGGEPQMYDTTELYCLYKKQNP